MSFEWPWQYNFPPFFTTCLREGQPSAVTGWQVRLKRREKQEHSKTRSKHKLQERLEKTWPVHHRNFPQHPERIALLQPNVDTRQKQLAAWCSLALSYCRHHKLYTLDVMEAQESPMFNNKKIERKLSMEAIQVVFEELRKKGNLEWLDKNKSRCLVMWRRPEEWGKLIYQWVSKTGMVNSVFTLYELSNGDETEGEEFHGLEDWMLLRSLQALQTEGKAELFTMDDGKGVKFF
ncbi:unnamed protein product [Oreochromis niloticus]|nr:unnamed protein product [Mustela putorius furo]